MSGGRIGIALAGMVSATIMLVIALFSHSWFVENIPNGDRRIQIGLKMSEWCEYEDCDTISNGALIAGVEDTNWDTWGQAAMVSLILTCIAFVVTTLIGAGQKIDLRNVQTSSRIALACCGFSLIALIAFTSSAPKMLKQMTDLGFSAGLGYVGLFLGLLSAIGLSAMPQVESNAPKGRMDAKRRPAATTLDAAGNVSVREHSASPVPACPSCMAPTEWMSQWQRYYCAECRHYL